MKNIGKLIFVMLLVFSMASVALAQDKKAVPGAKAKPAPKKVEVQEKKDGVPIIIEHSGKDELGGTLALKLKEDFRESVLFRLVDKGEKSVRIKIRSRSEFSDRPEIGSVYSIVWTFAESDEVVPFYLDQELGLVGFQNVDSSAAKLMNKTDKVADEYKYLFE